MFAINFIAYVAAFGTSILVMIHGWGIEPQSWGWILIGSFIGSCIGAIITSLDK